MPRKRAHEEMEASEPAVPLETSLLTKIRNMWEFAATMQFIFMFGKAVRIDEDFDIEDFESECLKPGYSEKLEEIGLQLLKWISSHRGLNYDIWDEYVRRQYQAKAPSRNPYGDEEEPKKFREFDIFTKIRILHQLTVWTFVPYERMRQAMPDYQKESDQLEWRVDPCGWDADEREYYVLDDNRLYRRTEPALPPVPTAKPKTKYTSKKSIVARRRERASKRRKVVDSDVEASVNGDDADNEDSHIGGGVQDTEVSEAQDSAEIDTYGGWRWECIAVSLQEYEEFLDANKKSKDANQKNLNKYIAQTVLPILQEQEEKRLRKIEARARKEAMEAKLYTAKRSSRLAARFEKEKEEHDREEIERQHALALAAAHREEERQHQMDNDRQSRMLTREQRIKEREFKRILMEEQLQRDAEEEKLIAEGKSRLSARALKDRVERNKRELSQLTEDEWHFDCAGCGKHGRNFDDGEHSISCERCNVWQHSKCLGISVSEAESNDFHFVCADCKRAEEEKNRPKISLKFKMGQSSPPSGHADTSPPFGATSPKTARFQGVQIPARNAMSSTETHPHTNGHTQQNLPPQGFFQPRPLPATVPAQPSFHTNVPVSSGPINGLFNGFPQSYQPPGSPPAHAQISPAIRPYNQASQVNGNPQPGLPHRIPSPVINKPSMSPTQGNIDVGPIAGVPGSSPPHQYSAPHINGHSSSQPFYEATPQQRHQRTASFNRTPSFSASQPFTHPQSGLSPTKHHQPIQLTQTPVSAQPYGSHNIIPTSSVPPKRPTFTTPTSSFNGAYPSQRSVSGTPIFPPAERLAPSPTSMNRGPVPTPSKQLTPRRSPEIELGNSAAVQALQNLASNGSSDVHGDGGQIISSPPTIKHEVPISSEPVAWPAPTATQ